MGRHPLVLEPILGLSSNTNRPTSRQTGEQNKHRAQAYMQ